MSVGAISRRWMRALGCLLLFEIAVAGQTSIADDWLSLDSQAAAFYDAGDLSGAIAAARQALKAATSPAQTGRSLDRLGFYTYTSGNLPDGEMFLRQSLDLREQAFGGDSPEYAETANDLAMLLRDQRKLDEARALAQRAAATRLRAFGEIDPRHAESLNTLGTVYAFGGDYAAAVSLFERAVIVHEGRQPADRATEEYGTLCINLAGTYQRLGKYAAARSTFAKGLDALRIKPGVKHPAYAASLLASAALEVDLGRYGEAERLYEEGGRLLKAELGDQHPFYASFLNNRGFLFQSIGNVAAAEADYQASLDLKRKLYGAASPMALSTLRNLAHLTYSRNHEVGERLLAEAVDTYAKAAAAPPFDYTSVLLGLARARRDRGALRDAAAIVQRAMTVSEQGLGVRHPLYAAAVRDLGTIEAAAGDFAAAARHLREAATIAEQVHGANHPDLVPFLEALAGSFVQQRNYQAALPLYRRSFEIQDRFLADVLEIGSENAKTGTMSATGDLVPMLISFQALASDALPAARSLAFEAVSRRKGRVLEQVRSWRQHLRETASGDVARRLADWQAMLECRTSLTLALGYRDLKPGVVGGCTLAGTEFAGRYERLLSDLRARWSSDLAAQAVRAIADLEARGDALETALNREAGGAYMVGSRASTEDIRARLRPDELLVEFVDYEGGDGAAAPGRRYGVFVLGSRGDLEWRDIGPAAPIDTAVRDLLTAANDWSLSVHNHEQQPARSSARTAHDALSRLSTQVWLPLKQVLDTAPDVRQLRIAPDAMLNLVPFEALGDGGDMIERFAITYVSAGRDLTAAAPDRPATRPVVIVSPGTDVPGHGPAASLSTTFRAGALARLPSAALEADDFRHIVADAEIYSGAEASEHRVKTLHGPSLIHVVGHGIVGGDADCAVRNCLPTTIAASSRAMTLSAIVLEEAYGRGGRSSDDGLLTPLELENIDLRGTEMLVLSQCQMASGSASIGEGVYGMRRAAAIAGARTFVAPLWNIEDRVQRTLMERFYSGLAEGQSRADALRRAKLVLRSAPATRDFLYWAPVILTGAASPLPPTFFRR